MRAALPSSPGHRQASTTTLPALAALTEEAYELVAGEGTPRVRRYRLTMPKLAEKVREEMRAVLLTYNTPHELVRVIGKDKVLEMFFGHVARDAAPSARLRAEP